MAGLARSREENLLRCSNRWIILIPINDVLKVNFTLIDFGLHDRLQDGGNRHSLYCHKYAEIREGSHQTPVCAGTERERNVYVSKGSTVYVTMPRVETNGPHFLLRYQSKWATMIEISFCLFPPLPHPSTFLIIWISSPTQLVLHMQ